MKKFIYILIILVSFNSCSEYQKALKATDTATKFKLGEELYNNGKFEKANKLFAQIVPDYRGKPQAEKLMYLYSQSFYKMKDYYVAGYQFERFASSYPKSEKETKEAIEKLQGFINLFPESEYLSEANNLVKELDFKLEKKAYSIAKQYNQISDYEASIKSFDNFIFDFPGSSLREDALFYKLDASFKLAIKSVEYKKENRLKAAKLNAETFKKAFANSKYIEDVNNMAKNIDEQLQTYSTKANI